MEYHVDARKVMRANALSVVGYHGGDPVTHDAFQRLLGPPYSWPLRKAYGRGGISTCAMVALGLMRRAGVDHADIQDGYADDIGSGLNVAKFWAQRITPNPAWKTPSRGRVPRIGDVIQVLGPMHVATVIGWETSHGGARLCVTVDGGQCHPRDGLQCIAVVRRPWVETPRSVRLGARIVDGWIDVAMLPYGDTATVPIGWEEEDT